MNAAQNGIVLAVIAGSKNWMKNTQKEVHRSRKHAAAIVSNRQQSVDRHSPRDDETHWEILRNDEE